MISDTKLTKGRIIMIQWDELVLSANVVREGLSEEVAFELCKNDGKEAGDQKECQKPRPQGELMGPLGRRNRGPVWA